MKRARDVSGVDAAADEGGGDEAAADESDDDSCDGVSFVIPCFNAAAHLDGALASVLGQTTTLALECVVVDDGSSDDSVAMASRWIDRFAAAGRRLEVVALASNGGAAAARNAGVASARWRWIVSADADDTSAPERVDALVRALRATPRGDRARTLFGSRFDRDPPDATARYAAWANDLAPERLRLECFRECTLLQPTWFFCKRLWEAAGRYDGARCDDLRFFLRHVLQGDGLLARVDASLVTYRRVEGSLSFATSRRELVRERAAFFASAVLDGAWAGKKVGVWGAGRDGREFVNALAAAGRADAVDAFYDVDPKKLGTYHNGATGLSLPVRDVSAIRAPFVVCVAMHRTGGRLEEAVRDAAVRLGAEEGVDYWHFN